VLWRFETSGKIRGAAVIDRQAVYFGGTSGELFRLDLKTGAEDWEGRNRSGSAWNFARQPSQQK